MPNSDPPELGLPGILHLSYVDFVTTKAAWWAPVASLSIFPLVSLLSLKSYSRPAPSAGQMLPHYHGKMLFQGSFMGQFLSFL